MRAAMHAAWGNEVNSASSVSHALLPTFDEARAASATIKGYLFQFDATLLAALEAPGASLIRVEGVEDFDEANPDWTRCVQCKYYEGTELSNTVLREVMLPMLRRLKSEKAETWSQWRFSLYGCFKGEKPVPKTLSSDDIFTSLKTYKVQPDKSHLPIDYAVIEGFDKSFVAAFAKTFSIIETPRFEEHRENVISRLSKTLGTTAEVTREIHHPAAIAYVAQLAANTDASKRVTSHDEILRAASPSSPTLHALLLRAFGERKYCATLRRQYFARLNIEPIHHLFAIHHRPGEEDGLVRSVATIAAKYGKPKSSKRQPSNEQRVPIVLLVDMPSSVIFAVKSQLYAEGVRFNDGFPFRDAAFDPKMLISATTVFCSSEVAIIDSVDHLNAVFALRVPVSPLYLFSAPSGKKVSVSGTLVDIPVGSFNWIHQII